MNKQETIDKLISELSQRQDIPFDIDRSILSLVLGLYDIDNCRNFYIELPLQTQSSDNPAKGVSYALSVRRLLVHRNIDQRISSLKEAYNKAVGKVAAYSSNNLAEELRDHPEIRGLLQHCESPCSLLGKLTKINYFDDARYRSIKPILVIPNLQDEERGVVKSWEESEMKYAKAISGKRFKKTTAKEYHAALL